MAQFVCPYDPLFCPNVTVSFFAKSFFVTFFPLFFFSFTPTHLTIKVNFLSFWPLSSLHLWYQNFIRNPSATVQVLDYWGFLHLRLPPQKNNNTGLLCPPSAKSYIAKLSSSSVPVQSNLNWDLALSLIISAPTHQPTPTPTHPG